MNALNLGPRRLLASQMALLALAYVLTGKLGLMLAVPPGYATIVWPPSGIALGMLLVYGHRLWPGVLIGSFVLNCHVSGALSVVDGVIVQDKALAALLIAIGSTAQALIGRAMLHRAVGLPLQLSHGHQLLKVMFLAGPLACLTAASLGNGALLALGLLPVAKLWGHWLTWWVGDVLGVLAFAPLVLLAPSRQAGITWRKRPLGTVPLLSMLFVVGLLASTLYVWKMAVQSEQAQSQARFESLAADSEKALQHRLATYQSALRGGVGLLLSTPGVTPQDWQRYVAALDIKQSLPGMGGIGYIEDIPPSRLPSRLKALQAAQPGFNIHPNAPDKPVYVVEHIEPLDQNLAAQGLNLAFEPKRREALEQARRTGQFAITRPITLVQDTQQALGFLLIAPVFNSPPALDAFGTEPRPTDQPPAFQGWVYAPLSVHNFLKGLTPEQGRALNVRVYDDSDANKRLVYDSDDRVGAAASAALFTVHKQLRVFDQPWRIEWRSTPLFEQASSSDTPLMVLMAGLLIALAFAVFAIIMAVRQTTTLEWLINGRTVGLPVGIFVMVVISAIVLAQAIRDREVKHMLGLLDKEATRIELMLGAQLGDEMMVLRHMAQRWDAAGGTPSQLWHSDAKNLKADLQGLQALAWIDKESQLKWIVSDHAITASVWTDVAIRQGHLPLMRTSREKGMPLATPPFQTADGTHSVFVYIPLTSQGKPDGFLASMLSMNSLFGPAATPDFMDNYSLRISYQGHDFFRSKGSTPEPPHNWHVSKTVVLLDHPWQMTLTPHARFIDSQRGILPNIILLAGLIIGVLAGLTARYAIVYRIKSESLHKSSQVNHNIFANVPHLIISTDADGLVKTFNHAAEVALGWRADEVIGRATPTLWHDESEVIARATALSSELGEHVSPGFDAFVRKATLQGVDSSEWSFIRKDKSRFPAHLTVSVIRALDGTPTGYIGVIEDITERKRQQAALKTSEETFRSAIEHAPIGMALVAPNGQWQKVNQALCDLLGYDAVALVTRDVQSVTHPEDLEAALALIHDALAGERGTYQIEQRLHHFSGRVIWCLMSMSLVTRPDGSPNYFVAHVQDITARREVERMKSEFIAIVSHELRAPLTSIRGTLDMIATSLHGELLQKVGGMIQIAHNHCERLVAMINDVLDIDKINTGQMRFDCKDENLAVVIRQAEDANSAFALKFGSTIHCGPMDKVVQCHVDAKRLAQVLGNFISNAAKFSPKGSQIDITLSTLEGYARISVADRGMGIPAEFRNRVFGKFSQLDATAANPRSGSGLGLHVSKQIVEHMRGRIGFNTEVGRGSVFWVEFPLVGVTAASN